jgi:hypothetical protein
VADGVLQTHPNEEGSLHAKTSVTVDEMVDKMMDKMTAKTGTPRSENPLN